MKKKFIKICVVMLGVMLAACLDDGKYALDPSSSHNIIEFQDMSVPSNPNGAIYPVYTNTTEIVPSFIVEQVISYSGPNGNSKDIELTIAVDPTALDEYNLQMTTGLNGKPPLGGGLYNLMPANYFSFTDVTATIPKGEKQVTISFEAFPGNFDLTKNFALPLRIVSASSGIISAHFSVAIIAVVVKNQYDGIYEIMGGSMTRNSASGPDPVLGGNYDAGLEMPLGTINGTSCTIFPLWKEGSGVGGIPNTQVAIDPATNLVTVTSGNATMKNTPGQLNVYDPVTKQFTLNFDWGNAPNTRIVANLVIKFDRPRP